MKNVIYVLGLVIMFVSLTSCSKKQPSEIVLSSFAHKFPATDNLKWDKENATEWEAEFEIEGIKYSANFSSEGEWMETEYEVDMDEVPNIIHSILQSKFNDYEVKVAEVSITPGGNNYELIIEKGRKEQELVFSENGEIIMK
tara:strand:+ start:669 stop:1094 length:426 start_codon:yes stop_codon:yes gene_type:complete